MLALKTIPKLSITVTENHINYIQTEVVTNLAPNLRKYHPYKKNTRKNYDYTPIYKYFYIEKTLHEQKQELTAANLTKEAIWKQLHNEFKTTAGPTNSYYKLRTALKLYDLFYACKNVLQNPILQPLKIQYIGKLTELKFQQFSDQIFSIILDYYLEITDNIWTLMELSLEEERPKTSSNNVNKRITDFLKKAVDIKSTRENFYTELIQYISLPQNYSFTPIIREINQEIEKYTQQ
ncbi:hypothetical protein G9A89_009810 [Geosiphon pyriformis]|nr:hypothetical protein G9A89_009810 [Geosiphon pyriformis]